MAPRSQVKHSTTEPLRSLKKRFEEHSGSVGRALDWGQKVYWFEPHSRWSHCHVSLSKTLYLLLSTGSTYEDLS